MQPSSRHLSHDYAAYKGLSLRELFWIVISVTPFMGLLSTLIGCLFAMPVAAGALGFFLGFILAISVCPKQIAKLKKDKPYGYLAKSVVITCSNFKVSKSPYVHYCGYWQTSKRVI